MGLSTPIAAIREKCIDCSGGQMKEVRLCPVTNCALWPYRMGRRPRHCGDTCQEEVKDDSVGNEAA